MYQTALALYERFEPLVEEHLATSPFAKVAFTVRSVSCQPADCQWTHFTLAPQNCQPVYMTCIPVLENRRQARLMCAVS